MLNFKWTLSKLQVEAERRDNYVEKMARGSSLRKDERRRIIVCLDMGMTTSQIANDLKRSYPFIAKSIRAIETSMQQQMSPTSERSSRSDAVQNAHFPFLEEDTFEECEGNTGGSNSSETGSLEMSNDDTHIDMEWDEEGMPNVDLDLEMKSIQNSNVHNQKDSESKSLPHLNMAPSIHMSSSSLDMKQGPPKKINFNLRLQGVISQNSTSMVVVPSDPAHNKPSLVALTKMSSSTGQKAIPMRVKRTKRTSKSKNVQVVPEQDAEYMLFHKMVPEYFRSNGQAPVKKTKPKKKLSEFERRRQETVARNNAKLKSMGIGDVKRSKPAVVNQVKKTKNVAIPVRKSGRAPAPLGSRVENRRVQTVAYNSDSDFLSEEETHDLISHPTPQKENKKSKTKLSEFERQREETIARNKAKLKSLGLEEVKPSKLAVVKEINQGTAHHVLRTSNRANRRKPLASDSGGESDGDPVVTGKRVRLPRASKKTSVALQPDSSDSDD